MKRYDTASIRDAFDVLSERANESLGMFDEGSIGMGRYVAGSSPWERHNNGDELLLVTDGEVQMGMSKNPQEDLKKAYKMASGVLDKHPDHVMSIQLAAILEGVMGDFDTACGRIDKMEKLSSVLSINNLRV